MALKDILEQIKKEAEKEIATLDAKRDKMITKITVEYNEKRDQEKIEMDSKVKENKGRVLQRAKTLASMETRNNLLKAKRKLLEDIFSKTVNALAIGEDYVAIITALLNHAKKEFSEGTIIPASGKESDTKKALDASGAPFKMSNNSANIEGGFLLEAGKIEMNFSFADIIRKQLWTELEMELNKLLFT